MQSITIITGGTVCQRKEQLKQLIGTLKPAVKGEVQVDNWEVPAVGTLQHWVNRFGYVAIHQFKQPTNAPYLPDMLRAFAKHHYPVVLTVNHYQDIPVELERHIKLINLDK